MLWGFFFLLSLIIGQLGTWYVVKNKPGNYSEYISLYYMLVVYLFVPSPLIAATIFFLPLIYLINSRISFYLYLLMIMFSEVAIEIYILLLSFSIPFFLRDIRKKLYSIEGQIAGWFMGIYTLLSIITYFKNLMHTSIASVILSSYFSTLYLLDRLLYRRTTQFMLKPFAIIRILGMTAMAQVFSLGIWMPPPNLSWQIYNEYIVLLILVTIAFYLFLKHKKDFSSTVFSSYFIVNVFCCIISVFSLSTVSLIQTIYSYFTGAALINEGVLYKDIFTFAAGISALCLQLYLRIQGISYIWLAGLLLLAIICFDKWRKYVTITNA